MCVDFYVGLLARPAGELAQPRTDLWGAPAAGALLPPLLPEPAHASEPAPALRAGLLGAHAAGERPSPYPQTLKTKLWRCAQACCARMRPVKGLPLDLEP